MQHRGVAPSRKLVFNIAPCARQCRAGKTSRIYTRRIVTKPGGTVSSREMSAGYTPYIRFVAQPVRYNVAFNGCRRWTRTKFLYETESKRTARTYPIAKPTLQWMWDALTARSHNARPRMRGLASLQPERSCSLRLNDDNEMLDRVSVEHPSSRR